MANQDCDAAVLITSAVLSNLYTDSLVAGQVVSLLAVVVTAVDEDFTFWGQAATGATQVGVQVSLDDQRTAPAVGDEVRVTGVYRAVDEDGSGLGFVPTIDVSVVGNVTVDSSGNTLPAPLSLVPADLADPFDALSMLVTVAAAAGDLTIDNVHVFGEVDVTDGTDV